jgi:hypothetical protein
MATITLTVGSITIERTMPDDRMTNILTTAFNPPEDETPRKRLAFCLDALLEETRITARRNRTQELKRKAEQDAGSEFD